MRLEKKNQEVLDKRKGLTGRTIAQIVWLAISFVGAYFLMTYLVNGGFISYSYIYDGLGLPSSVPPAVVKFGFMLVIVFVMQFFLVMGFMFADPEGRRKLGEPTLKSRNKDPFDQPYNQY